MNRWFGLVFVSVFAMAALMYSCDSGSGSGSDDESNGRGGDGGTDGKSYITFNGNGQSYKASPEKIELVKATIPGGTYDIIAGDELGGTYGTYSVITDTYHWVIKDGALPAKPPTKAGYVFMGYNTKADGAGVPVTGDWYRETKGNTTVYAQWISDSAAENAFLGYGVEYKFGGTTSHYPGFYLIELWGAQGWNPPADSSNNYAGKGAYTRGILEVTQAEIDANNSLWIYIAQEAPNSPLGAYGGGGGGNLSGSGGGASDIRWGGTSTYHRIIVAAGGGGANDRSLTGEPQSRYTNTRYSTGGYGGGLTGGDGSGGDDNGRGATQTAGGLGGPGMPGTARPGTFYEGGWYVGVVESTGGGGGGYFGGGAAGQKLTNGGGGGGASFISGFTGCIAIVSATSTSSRVGDDPFNGFTTGEEEVWERVALVNTELDLNSIELNGVEYGGNNVYNTSKENVLDYEFGDGGTYRYILADETAEPDVTANPYYLEIKHIIERTGSVVTKSVHFTNKHFIPQLVLFKGENSIPNSGTYTTTMIAGNAAMPKTLGTGTELGHSGQGFGKIIYLGDGIGSGLDFGEHSIDEDEENEPVDGTAN
ncbi:hypothetical protein AGMMS50212_07520 [Spirochaetia bacterium]|nr:hypothetical protein AGMMS50212_07520 [Spirochaetia bacterium]